MSCFNKTNGGLPLSVLLLTVIVLASIPKIESITNGQKNAIEKGLSTGKEVLDSINRKEFTQTLTKIGRSVGPFLRALVPFVRIVMTMGDSAELTYMKEMMKRIDNRFDQMDSRFDEIERLVDWTKVAVNFGQIEQKIRAVDVAYEHLYTSAAPASQKGPIFRRNYLSDYQNSGLKLYLAIVNRQGIFQENLGQSVMRYTRNDRKKTQEFLLGVLRLLMRAGKLEIAYHTVSGHNITARERERMWTTRIQTVKSKFEQIDTIVKGKYHSQSKIDIKKLSADNYGMGNREFSNKLYSMLIEKYFWRDWFVVVYNPIIGGNNHWVGTCGGHHFFRQNGRNIVVSSIDKDQSADRMTVQSARQQLNAVEVREVGWLFRWVEFSKHYYDIIKNIGACSAIVIDSDADVSYKGDPNKIAYRKASYNLSINAPGWVPTITHYYEFILFNNYRST